jgi:multidrug efflux system membrane fusion protein
VEIRPRVSGFIENVRYKKGSEVKKGGVLFVIDPRLAAEQLANAAVQARPWSRRATWP